MDKVSQLLQSVLSKLNIEHLENYLSTCLEHQAFSGNCENKESEAYVKLVNVLLNNNEDRLGGLLVLQAALQQCSLDVFVDNATSWMINCLKATNDKGVHVINIACSVLGTLLKLAIKFPEIKKFASNNVVPHFLEHVNRPINPKTLHSLLECLAICMLEYSGPCGEYNKSITSLLTKLVDSEPNLLSQAAKCYALLSHIKGDSKQGISFQNVWKTNQLVLVNTLHHCLNQLFASVTEIQAFHPHEKQKDKLSLNLGGKSSLLRMQLLERCIKGTSAYLQSMLLGSFPVAKPILPDAILGVICRGLAVTCLSLGRTTNDSIALASVLPDVHVDLLKLLLAFIISCGRNLIPYGSLICKLVSQELKWTASINWPYALDKPYRTMRAVVYRCLRCWLSIARSAASLETVIEDIIQSIMSEIQTEKPTVTLKMANKSQGKSKKNLPHLNLCSESRSDKLGFEYANEDVCLEALKCLQMVLYSFATKIKAITCKQIQETVLTLLYAIQNKQKDPPVPYRSIPCKRELYSSLIILCMEPHSTFPPPLTHAISVLNYGLADSESEISVMCMTGLSNLEKIIHPAAPSLPGTLQFEDIQETPNAETEKLDDSTGSQFYASINNIPLSMFPNLNKITLIKFVQNENSDSANVTDDKIGLASGDPGDQTIIPEVVEFNISKEKLVKNQDSTILQILKQGNEEENNTDIENTKCLESGEIGDETTIPEIIECRVSKGSTVDKQDSTLLLVLKQGNEEKVKGKKQGNETEMTENRDLDKEIEIVKPKNNSIKCLSMSSLLKLDSSDKHTEPGPTQADEKREENSVHACLKRVNEDAQEEIAFETETSIKKLKMSNILSATANNEEVLKTCGENTSKEKDSCKINGEYLSVPSNTDSLATNGIDHIRSDGTNSIASNTNEEIDMLSSFVDVLQN